MEEKELNPNLGCVGNGAPPGASYMQTIDEFKVHVALLNVHGREGFNLNPRGLGGCRASIGAEQG